MCPVLGKNVWGPKVQKAMLATIQNSREFDMIKNSKYTLSQQSMSLFRQEDIQTMRICHTFNTSHKPRQCPAYGKTSSSCGKAHYFQQICRSVSRCAKQVRQKRKPKLIHEACQSDEELCKGSDEKMDRATDTVTIKSFNFNSMNSIIVTKLEIAAVKKVLYWNTN